MMFRTATLRSGYMLQETSDFADSIERMMRQTLGVSVDEQPEEEEYFDDQAEDGGDGQDEADEVDDDHDEL